MSDAELEEQFFAIHREWFSRVGGTDFAVDWAWIDEIAMDEVVFVTNEAEVLRKSDFRARVGNVTTFDQRAFDLGAERLGADAYITWGHFFIHGKLAVDDAPDVYFLDSNRFIAVWKQVEPGRWRLRHFQATEHPTPGRLPS
jgi:hypothetical protein